MQQTRRLGLLVLLAFAPLCVAAGPPRPSDRRAAPQPKPKLVRVVIDYGDGVEKHFTRIPWKQEMTVQDAMNAAKAWPHGIDFRYTGRGATAFLTQMDDLKNEGAEGKNWLFHVNGKLATKSFGVLRLEAGDRVTWTFQKFRFGE